MPLTRDYTGHRFGMLVAVRSTEKRRNGKIIWVWRCDCGREIERAFSSVHHTKSCGCFVGRPGGKEHHGMHDTRAYHTWSHLIDRCTNPNAANFYRYGGRGINVCERWKKSFVAFSEDMGEPPPGTSIDRIDNSKGYEPGNCRWATCKEQSRNTRQNRWITYNGVTKCMVEWAEDLGMSKNTLRNRIYAGWSVEKALTTSVYQYKSKAST